MNTYERIFGAGPRGLLISLALFVLAWRLESLVGLPKISSNDWFRWVVLVLAVIGSFSLALWSVRSLAPAARGIELVTVGAFRYLRHPLYAALLSCFNLGLAVAFNNWIYIVWAVLLHGVWHWNIKSEEELMRQQFPREYEKYCRKTGRFVPRIW